MTTHKILKPTYGIAVDASCLPVQNSKKVDGFFHGILEWQGLDLRSGAKLFASKVYSHGNVNLGEYIAIIDALSLLHGIGDTTTIVYSDSKTAIAWYNNCKARSKHPENEKTSEIMTLFRISQEWRNDVRPPNPVLFWNKDVWDENPADFGRK